MWNISELLNQLNIDLTRLHDLLVYNPHAPMIFSSGIFLWLFAAFILFYLLLQRRTTARLMFVTLFSYYFYYKSSGAYFFLLAIVTVSDFFIARLYSANPPSVVCFQRDVRQGDFPYCERTVQEGGYLGLYQYQLCGAHLR